LADPERGATPPAEGRNGVHCHVNTERRVLCLSHFLLRQTVRPSSCQSINQSIY